MVNAVINIRNLRRMTGRAGHAGAGRDRVLDGQLRRGAVAIVGVAVTGRTAIVLGRDIAEGHQAVAAVVMTGRTALLGGL